MKVLANDGISKSGILALEKGGFEVITTKVAQEQVANYVNTHNISVVLVRSATKVRKDIIDACPGLKIIGRGGVGMDNIDVEYARSKGVHVINTPASSSESVAELVFAHLFTGVRFLHDANRNMPLEGDTNFDGLKKAYANGIELRGKTLGIIGFGLDEVALVEALDNDKVLFAGLDVFENEPTPEIQILMHTKISLTPHIGAATLEAQDRIGTELAEQIISLLKSEKV
jgi:phosphoglycerate dehydrogenase-like enzyme